MYSTKYFLFIFVLFIGISANCQVINTIAGNGTSGWHGDGEYATSAQLSWPEHVRADNAGNIYIADFLNGRIRKVDTFGIITTIAGNGLNVYSGDGGPAAYASIEYPISLGFDGAGNLYIAEDSSYAWSGIGMGGSRIRKVDAAGIITTIAGNSYGGAGGFIGDGGPATAAQFYSVFDIAVDAIGNIYICDLGNLRIRKIDTAGIINTIAGSGAYGWSGDGGPAIEAEFTTPMGITVDGTGNVYIADFTNNNIRKVDTFGIISTIAGNLMYGFSGDSGQATAVELWSPTGVAVDGTGNVYIADQLNYRIREVNTAGIITTITGNGTGGWSGDGGPATAAEIYINGITIDSTGNIYFSDDGDNIVRTISAVPDTSLAVQSITNNQYELHVSPNPNQGSFIILFSTPAHEPAQITVTNILGEKIKEYTINTNQETTIQLDAPPGMYFLTALTKQGIQSTKILVQ